MWRVVSTNHRSNTREERLCTIAGTVILYRCFLTDGTDTKASASVYTTADNKSTLIPRLPDSCVRVLNADICTWFKRPFKAVLSDRPDVTLALCLPSLSP